MSIVYYRWVRSSSADRHTALQRNQLRQHYHNNSGQEIESRSALWVFRMDVNGYRPGTNIAAERTLLRINLKPDGEAIMESAENHLDFESPDFKGEAQHPLLIITKRNEPGARGIGATILQHVNARVASIVAASDKEVKLATK